MRIVCISDTHLQHDFDVPEGDLLIHAGDGTWTGDIPQIAKWAKWLGTLPHKHKVAIAGNHDWGFQRESYVSRLLMQDNGVTYLEDSHTVIDGLKLYGSPWQPEFCNWAFNLPRAEMELYAKWQAIPTDTDILITHGPPLGILDVTAHNEPVGCFDLAQRIRQLDNLKLHVFGHIHHSYGVDAQSLKGKQFVNAAICNESYDPLNEPIVITL